MRWFVTLSLFCLYIGWGTTYGAMKIANESFGPFAITAIRFGISGLILLIYCLATSQSLGTLKQWINAWIVGSLMAICIAAVVHAEVHSSTGLVAVAIGSIPLWVSLFSFLSGNSVKMTQWIGMALGLAGILIISKSSQFSNDQRGFFIVGIGALSWSFGTLLVKKLSLPTQPVGTAAQLITGGMTFTIAAVLSKERLGSTISSNSIIALAYLVLIGSLLCYRAYTYLVDTVSYPLATSYATVNPIVALITGSLLLREPISSSDLIASLVVISGVTIITFSNVPSQKEPKTVN